MRNFWSSLGFPLINCETEFDLTWSKYCVISEIFRTPEVGRANSSDATLKTGATFQINNAKLYVPVFTSSINDNTKYLENIKEGSKRTISWNKYRFEITLDWLYFGSKMEKS